MTGARATNGLARETRRRYLAAIEAGALPVFDLKERVGDCRVLRAVPVEEESFIVKLWDRGGHRAWLRRVTGTSPAQREYAALRRLQKAGVRSPAPLGPPDFAIGSTARQALFLEDLGDCRPSLFHVKELLAGGREDELEVFLDDVIELTRDMIEADVIDPDHGFGNVVATPDGRAARIDLELATVGRRRPAGPQGEMLGRLLATFAFAVQPDDVRFSRFAAALLDALAPDRTVRQRAAAQFDSMMDVQERERGLTPMVLEGWA